MSSPATDPVNDTERVGLNGVLQGYRRRFRRGDIGQLPVVIGLVAIWAIFGLASHGTFLEAQNLVNLALQMSAVGTMAVGVVFVLLLGEIDLTIGIVSGLSAAVMAVLSVKLGLPDPVAVLGGLLVGMGIGLFQGLWVTRLGIPSFVVTLAGLIGWQGVLLWVIGDTGTINLGDGLVQRLAGTFFDFPAAVGLAALFIAYLGWAGSSARRRRLHAGLTAERMSVLWLRIGGIAVVVTAAVLILAQDRGLPLSMVLLVALIVVMDYIARRTRFGRMVYAVGGNAEAARRAGIPVLRVRTAVFVLAGLLSAWGGMLAASRLLAVYQSSGSGPELLNAIAAAVIGGTSLFGGRGTVWAALLGILVIQSISNGMDLLNFTPAFKQMITGGVLLTAVTIDAVVRRR